MASDLINKVNQAVEDFGKYHDVVNGPAQGDGSQVETGGGPVKTLARVLYEVPSAQADRIAATAAAADAVARAIAAAASESNSDASAAAAAASAVLAGSARDAAQLAGLIYTTTAEGVGATPDGRYFCVVATDIAGALVLCQRTGPTFVQKKIIPSLDGVSAFMLEVATARAGAAQIGDRLNGIVAAVGAAQLVLNGMEAQLATYRPYFDEVRLDPSNPVEIEPAPLPLKVTLQTLLIARGDADIPMTGVEVTFDDVASVAVVAADFTLRYADGPANFPGEALAYLDVSDLVVKRADTGEELSDTRDYAYKEGSGMVYGRQNVADTACKVTYTGHKRRYDLVCVNPNTSAVTIVKGTERVVDSAEYRPTAPAALLPLYWALVDYRGVTLTPVHAFKGFGRIGPASADYLSHLEYCRARLFKALGRAARGQSIRLIGYGDSITAQGGGNPAADGSVGNQLVPNLDRDKLEGFYYTDQQPEIYGRMPVDTRALYPKYDHGDGLGQVHVHLGWNWYLKAALEALGANVTYRNWGVGGTKSEESITSGLYNGRHPDRLGAAVADGGHLVVIEFGMNELGQPFTFENTVEIIHAFQATGHECIVVTPPMISSTGLRAPIEQWRDTTHQLIMAATVTDSAFVNCMMIEDVPGYGISGIPPRDAAWINGFNHPGPTQLSYIGRALADIVGVRLPQGWM